MPADPTSDSIVVASRKALASALGGEVILLELDEGAYYSLNPVGAKIWELIQAPIRLETVCGRLIEEYEVTEEECLRDVLRVVSDLLERGLAETRATLS